MKKLLWILPLLIGCSSAAPLPVSPVENPPPPPVAIAGGNDGVGVEWRCELQTYTHALAFVQCDFRNNYSIPATSGCTTVSFWSNSTQRLVVESKRICSGDLMPGETKTKYVAFQKDKRESLRKCGEDLQSCVMLAGNSPE